MVLSSRYCLLQVWDQYRLLRTPHLYKQMYPDPFNHDGETPIQSNRSFRTVVTSRALLSTRFFSTKLTTIHAGCYVQNGSSYRSAGTPVVLLVL